MKMVEGLVVLFLDMLYPVLPSTILEFVMMLDFGLVFSLLL